MPQPFDIVNAVKKFNDCEDMRPWLIFRVLDDGSYKAFPIATRSYGDPHFPLESNHVDFSATGLKHSCVIVDVRTYLLKETEIKKERGKLCGVLLCEFRKYSGV